MIHGELRVDDKGEPEVWVNLGDVLDWLDTLPANTAYASGAQAAMEIRQMLFDFVDNAELIRGKK